MKRCLLQAVHKALNLPTQKERLQHDIFDRRLDETIPSDLCVAGFPCPAYSTVAAARSLARVLFDV